VKKRKKKNDELEIKLLTFSPEKQLNNSRNKQNNIEPNYLKKRCFSYDEKSLNYLLSIRNLRNVLSLQEQIIY